jgi:hypothetical protein
MYVLDVSFQNEKNGIDNRFGVYLARAILLAGAIVLVYYNGILDVIHDCMLEKNISSKTIARPSPRLNSQSIFCTGKCSGHDCNILHTSLLGFFA